MNNSLFFLRLLTSLLLTASIAGCAGGKTHESTGEYFDDVAITSKVKTSILGDGKLRFFQIDVTTFKGIVQLSGFVDNKEISTRASEVTRTIKGVKMVNNNLIVK
ncbi:MAG: BON domain-containing protein [Methylococcales bacterium]|nr:BON domain-containing protein [Methylococcales bacterium]